jgi:UDP-N-acetylmuramoylalanine--D-glutamate ligase
VGGVTYVNDSKATNVDATLKALTAYSTGVYLILGGYDKGAEYGALAAATEGLVKQALLIGATAPQLEAAFAARAAAAGSRATPHVVCGDLEVAVMLASREASPGDVVLLSPACASWDQYRDYVERGEQFLKLVSDLRGVGPS